MVGQSSYFQKIKTNNLIYKNIRLFYNLIIGNLNEETSNIKINGSQTPINLSNVDSQQYVPNTNDNINLRQTPKKSEIKSKKIIKSKVLSGKTGKPSKRLNTNNNIKVLI